MSNAYHEQAVANLNDIAQGGNAVTDLEKLPALYKMAQAIPKLPAKIPESAPAGAAGVVPGSTASPDIAMGQNAQHNAAVQLAAKYLGVKYTWGGTSASTGFDCSGLLQTVWRQLGVNIPRTTYEQWGAGQAVTGPLKPGDAVFFRGSDPQGGLPGHVGLYIGNGKMIVAPHTGTVVQIQSVASQGDYMGARRY